MDRRGENGGATLPPQPSTPLTWGHARDALPEECECRGRRPIRVVDASEREARNDKEQRHNARELGCIDRVLVDLGSCWCKAAKEMVQHNTDRANSAKAIKRC